MRLIINDKNVNLTDREREYIEKKMAGMEKFLNKNTKLEIFLNDVRGGDKEGVDKRIEAVTKSFGKVINVSEEGVAVRETIDRLSDRLLRALRKRKEKRVDRLRRTKAFLKRALPGRWFGGKK